MNKRGRKIEREHYEIIKTKLEELFVTRSNNVHLEITANGKFSNKLKSKIPQGREIIFSFLKREASPDITGFVEEKNWVSFITVEIKRDEIKLDDIYQARKYGELFDARYGFLISLQPIQEEIKRLSRAVYSLLALPADKTLTLTHFDEQSNEFIEWFRENPFQRQNG